MKWCDQSEHLWSLSTNGTPSTSKWWWILKWFHSIKLLFSVSLAVIFIFLSQHFTFFCSFVCLFIHCTLWETKKRALIFPLTIIVIRYNCFESHTSTLNLVAFYFLFFTLRSRGLLQCTIWWMEDKKKCMASTWKYNSHNPTVILTLKLKKRLSFIIVLLCVHH